MESNDKTEGERGVLTKKISRYFCREASAKDGEVTGLRGGEEPSMRRGFVRGGKSESKKIEDGTEVISQGSGERDKEGEGSS